jgi:peptide/nickel transport system permease protein
MSSRYILRKLFNALVTILAIVVLNFVLFRMMPGSPERQTRNPNLRPEVIASMRERWGLDKPIPEQLVLTLNSKANGHIGS